MENEENMTHSFAYAYAWGLDFWRAFLEKPKFIRMVCLILMGKYARNELLGMKEAIERNGDGFYFEGKHGFGYGMENQEYHKKLDKYKNW
jgi:hypothetical protein